MSTSEERFERLVSDMLGDIAPTRLPDDLLDESERAVDAAGRWPRWLALMKEPPMRYSSQLAVGSPTARVATILAATILLTAAVAGAGIAGSRLLAADGVIIVDPSGAGTVTTIAAALEMAEDGDEVLVRPGTYVEAVTIDHDITLRGDGPRGDIVLMAPGDGPTHIIDTVKPKPEPYALLLSRSDAVISGLTLRGEAAQLHVEGGAPTIEDLYFDGVGRPHDRPHGRGLFPDGIGISGDARAVVRDSTFVDGGPIVVYEHSSAQVIDNRLSGGPSIILFEPAADSLVRGNAVAGTLDRGIGVFGPSRLAIEGNSVRDAAGDGISVGFGTAADNDPVVRDNTIVGSQKNAINVQPDAAPIIEGNHVESSTVGLWVGTGTDDMVVRDNVFCDNTRNLVVDGLGEAELPRSNDICADLGPAGGDGADAG